MTAQLKDTGLTYLADDANMSVYRLQAQGVHLFDVLVDNATTIDPLVAEASGVKVQMEGATLHPIFIRTPDGKVTLPTAGYGAKYAHIENEGVSAPHIDGLTVAQYVQARALPFMARLLEARSAL